MIINGNFESLEMNDSLDMKDENGTKVLSVSRNRYMPDKVYIKSASEDIEYFGETTHDHDIEEFILFDKETQILSIKQTSGLSMPKFDITSPFGKYTTKFSLRKRNLILLDGDKEVLTLIGSPPNYQMVMEDSDYSFYLLCIAYGITSLLPLKLLYKIIS